MAHQNQIKSESYEHSSVRLARNTLPPSPVASVLVRAEKSRAEGDTVITMQDHPEVINMVAELLKVEPFRVTVHMMMVNGTLIQAIFVDTQIQRSVAAKTALNRINTSGLNFDTSSQDLSLELNNI